MNRFNSRLCLETLEERTVPSGCRDFGADVADAAQNFEPNLGALVSFIAHTESGAVAAFVAATQEAFCS